MSKGGRDAFRFDAGGFLQAGNVVDSRGCDVGDRGGAEGGGGMFYERSAEFLDTDL